MMRRNLRYGFLRGVTIGIGASSADVTYLLLLLFGILPLIKTSTNVLHTLGVISALLLCFFAYNTIKQKTTMETTEGNDRRLFHCFLSGYLIAFLSPFNIIFWLAVAAQFATLVSKAETDYPLACIGLFIGTALWFVSLNTVVHFTRHRISLKTAHRLNIVGGITLIAFALYGVWHVFTKL
jgi:L-lysine exporter family protein LysE/ArgO